MLWPKSNLRHWMVLFSFIPLMIVIFDIIFDRLGANPIQGLHIRLGDWSLRFLCLTLAITPLQTLTRWRGMADYRQMFGLFCFFYATLHVLAYLMVDHALHWRTIFVEILQSSYIWFGLLAYILLLLLAVTSPKAAKKSMGKSWKKLHRWIYFAAFAAILHYFWQLKGNLAQPFFYALLVSCLLIFRVGVWFKDKQFNRMMIPKSPKHTPPQ